MKTPKRSKQQTCPVCGRKFWMAPKGRPKVHCSALCRWHAWKQRQEALEREAKAAGAVV